LLHSYPISPPFTVHPIPIQSPLFHLPPIRKTQKHAPNVKPIQLPQKAYKQYETLLYKKIIYIVYNNKHTLFPSVLCVRFPLSLFNHQYVSILIRIDVSRIVLIARGWFMGMLWGCYGDVMGMLWGCYGENPPQHANTIPPMQTYRPPTKTRHTPPCAV